MKLLSIACLALVLIMAPTSSTFSQVRENLALSGRPILGYSEFDNGSLGTEYSHVGAVSNVNDGDPTTRSDTWGGRMSDVPFDFVGVVWPEPITENITSVQLTMATFVDGGWFGSGRAGAGRALMTPDLSPQPRLQATVDGESWFDLLNYSSNYAEVMNGHNVGGNGLPNPTTSPTVEFSLALSDILGLRAFGEGGGNAGDDAGGFLGVFEFAVLAAVSNPDAGDFNSDGSLGIVDINALMTEIAGENHDPAFDLNGDNLVNDDDRDVWLLDAGPKNGFTGSFLLGDTNLDGDVDAGDLNNTAIAWRNGNTRWSNGNFTGKNTDAADLNLLAVNWRKSVPLAASVAVPEPRLGVLIWPVFLVLAWRRRALCRIA